MPNISTKYDIYIIYNKVEVVVGAVDKWITRLNPCDH